MKLALSLVPGLILKSHPTWVRGLKHVAEVFVGVACVSHPTWVRGLKPVFKLDGVEIFSVAPYVGAWIETIIYWQGVCRFVSRTLRGCVD